MSVRNETIRRVLFSPKTTSPLLNPPNTARPRNLAVVADHQLGERMHRIAAHTVPEHVVGEHPPHLVLHAVGGFLAADPLGELGRHTVLRTPQGLVLAGRGSIVGLLNMSHLGSHSTAPVVPLGEAVADAGRPRRTRCRPAVGSPCVAARQRRQQVDGRDSHQDSA